jgi:ribonuclease R
MSKVIYDRSGKPHVIGGKGKSSDEEEAPVKKGAGDRRSTPDRRGGTGGASKFSAKTSDQDSPRIPARGGRGGGRDFKSNRDFKPSSGGPKITPNETSGDERGPPGSRFSREERGGAAKEYSRGGGRGHAGGSNAPRGGRGESRGGGRGDFRGGRGGGAGAEGTFLKKEKGAIRGARPILPHEREVVKERTGKYESRRSVKNSAKKAGLPYAGEKSSQSFAPGKKPWSKEKSANRGGKEKTFGGGRNPKGSKGGDKKGGKSKNGKFQPAREGKPRPQREPNPDWITLKGIVDKNKRGSAFIVFDNRQIEDAFVPRYYMDQLFHGDRVQVFVNDDGEIEDLKVLEHRFKTIFGKVFLEYSASKVKSGHLVYERKKAKEEVYLPTVPKEVKEGDWVKAELIFGENNQVTATVAEVIGETLPASYDIQMVAGEFNLKEHHSFDAVKQAESYTLEVPGKDELGRTDLRHMPLFTIDGERARDFDDAVYVERLEDKGFRLWVAIADVSHYVKKGTPLDDEAYARATSVYFPERAFHMLPRALSEELCSLKPKVPRLAMACSIDYSPEGVKGEVKVYNALIESRRRATYNEIEAEKEQPEHADMMALYRILKRDRHSRGSIDFDFPEAEIQLDEKTGEPTDIVVRPRNDAHRLIEEFMIAANESVTEWMMDKQLPFIYRVHQEPSMEAITKFTKLAKNMGVNLMVRDGIPRPAVLSEFIATLKGHVAEPVLATALLRSMRQAVYSGTYGEHYGLASDGYTHFTSPIRRYPDLIVHRLLRAALNRENEGKAEPSGKELDEEQKQLEEMAEHCSYRERVATEAERESIRFKQIRLMAKHLGEEFEGKVNGLTEKGMFIQLWHPYCEGMVPVDTMRDDWYEFNEERMTLFGRKKRKTFTIGKKVKIRVVKVDLDSRRIEFELLESSDEEKQST